MSYGNHFRYPPPGFEQHYIQSDSPNLQYQNPAVPPTRFHRPFTASPPDYRYPRPPPYNRFTPPVSAYEHSRFSFPPPFNPNRPPPTTRPRPPPQSVPFRPHFRPGYRCSSAPPRSRSFTKPDYRRERDDAPLTERDQLLVKWRSNYCETSDDITRKLAEMDPNENRDLWIRSSPADVYYKRCENGEVVATNRLDSLCTLFDQELVARGPKIREKQPPYEIPPRKRKHKVCRHKCNKYFFKSGSCNCGRKFFCFSGKVFVVGFVR